jgi:PleD family two-component response regulator
MVNIGRGAEDVEDSLPRTPLSERRKSMEAKTILIVDDDDFCRSGTEKALQRDYEFQRSSGKDQL